MSKALSLSLVINHSGVHVHKTEANFTDLSCLSSLSVRGETPPACDDSTEGNTRWRLQYDVYQYFVPENDLSERSLFSSIQAVADVKGMMENGKQVGHQEPDRLPQEIFNMTH